MLPKQLRLRRTDCATANRRRLAGQRRIDQPKDNSDVASRIFIAILTQGRNMTLTEYLCYVPFARFARFPSLSLLGQENFQGNRRFRTRREWVQNALALTLMNSSKYHSGRGYSPRR